MQVNANLPYRRVCFVVRQNYSTDSSIWATPHSLRAFIIPKLTCARCVRLQSPGATCRKVEGQVAEGSTIIRSISCQICQPRWICGGIPGKAWTKFGNQRIIGAHPSESQVGNSGLLSGVGCTEPPDNILSQNMWGNGWVCIHHFQNWPGHEWINDTMLLVTSASELEDTQIQS